MTRGWAPALLAPCLLLAGCAHRPGDALLAHGIRADCSTSAASIAFDFDGASRSRCVIEGERRFTVLVSPEHAPPINPSPWYAFRYEARGTEGIEVTLAYLEGRHRYPPKLEGQGSFAPLPVSVAEDGKSAIMTLPAGAGRVSGQEIFDGSRYEALFDRLAVRNGMRRFTLGTSHDGHPVDAIAMGDPGAPELVVLLGRAHPPEVSGAVAMEAFLLELAGLVGQGGLDPSRFQVIAVPLLNPDGVRRGHWRANLGGRDLNRDWGEFTQPETRAVKAWLDSVANRTRPVAMVDFHSTRDNLFYVQGEAETDAREEAFLDAWLVGTAGRLQGYPFTVERRNANPGSGTSKNWFHETYDIPAYTYEVGDETDRAATADAARHFARRFVVAVAALPPPR